MYRGYNIDFRNSQPSFELWKDVGEKIYATTQRKVISSLNEYISPDGIIDGRTMQQDWFPQVDADIFLSHSHRNEDTVIGFAGWLYEKFGLTSFIDSEIWGYSNDLLKAIDRKFCYKSESRTYDYDLRNESTSHVHMMLLVALAKMMDKTECLFLINTDDSIMASETLNRTKSPWIYSEVALSQIVRIQDIKREKTVRLFESGGEIQKSFSQTVPVEHYVDMGHLTKLSIDDLKSWMKLCKVNKEYNIYREYPLDLLYSIK